MFPVDATHANEWCFMTEKGKKCINGISVLGAKIKCPCELDLSQRMQQKLSFACVTGA